MRVVMVKPCQYAYITELDEKLESMQAAVGGLIDCVYPWDEKVCIVCNDEAVINGMQANRAMNYYGAIFGPFFVCGIEGNKFCSLSEEQAQRYCNRFLRPQLFLPTQKGLGCFEYDNFSLPHAPQEEIVQFQKRKGLPDFCFCLLPSTGEAIAVQYGDNSYIRLELQGGKEAGKFVEQLNKRIGVTKQQQAAMLWGSLFGWDVPAADPARYDDEGMPHKPRGGSKKDNPER